MNRRQFVTATAAAALATPFLRPATAKAAGLTGPTEATAGAIDISDRVKGYTVGSVRNHSINTYFVKGPQGTIAIDTLWRIPEAREGLDQAPALPGRSPEDISVILITHMHSDHLMAG